MTQIRSSSLRRLVVPLGLSLALHALFVALAWLAPSSRPDHASTGTPSPLSVSVCFDERREARIVEPPPGVGLPEDVYPEIRFPDRGQDVYVAVPSSPAGVATSHESAGGKGAAPGLRASASILSAPAQTRRITYVIDRSISMGASGALERARVELVLSLRALPAEARFQVIVYNHFAHALLPGGWLTPDATTLADVERRLLDLSASGGTDHVGALRQAMLTRPEWLFWVTDADELTEAGVREVTRLNTSHTRMQVVELATGKADDDSLLARLARNNGGNHRRVAPMK